MGNCFKPKEEKENVMPLMETNLKESSSVLAE